MPSPGSVTQAACDAVPAIRRVALEGLAPFRPAAYGVHRLLARKQLLLARAQALPGYEEAQV